MEADEAANLALIRGYLSALERGESGIALERFFTPDAIQNEFPTRLNPHSAQSELTALLERAGLGRHAIASQQYLIRSEFAQADAVAMEAEWVATLAVPVGVLPAGGRMRAHFAMFFECLDGKIHRQRNYECFEPW